jgi:hypothetical protein
MNLNSLSAAETADVEITHPVSGEPTGITVTVASQDSAVYRDLQRKQSEKRMQKLAKAGRRSAVVVSPEDLERDNLELLAGCTLGWKGLEIDDKEVPFSVEKAKELYAQPQLRWFRQQLDEAISDRSLFFASSPKSSSPSPSTSSGSPEPTSVA